MPRTSIEHDFVIYAGGNEELAREGTWVPAMSKGARRLRLRAQHMQSSARSAIEITATTDATAIPAITGVFMRWLAPAYAHASCCNCETRFGNNRSSTRKSSSCWQDHPPVEGTSISIRTGCTAPDRRWSSHSRYVSLAQSSMCDSPSGTVFSQHLLLYFLYVTALQPDVCVHSSIHASRPTVSAPLLGMSWPKRSASSTHAPHSASCMRFMHECSRQKPGEEMLYFGTYVRWSRISMMEGYPRPYFYGEVFEQWTKTGCAEPQSLLLGQALEGVTES